MHRLWSTVTSRPRLLAAVTCLTVVAVVAAALVRTSGPRRRDAPAKALSLTSTLVSRGSLVTTQRDHGQLRYPSRGSVHLNGAGTVTSLPRVGRVLRDGTAIAGVDDRPVAVLFGRAPLYRTLGAADPSGAQLAVAADRAQLLGAEAALARAQPSASAGARSSGREPAASVQAAVAQAEVAVAQSRRRLLGAQQALGHVLAPQRGPDVALVSTDMTALGFQQTVTDTWDPALADAVRHWQQQLGAAADGRIDPDDVVVTPGAVRVTAVSGQVGDAPSAITLSLSSATRVATFTLRHGAPAALAPGRRVRLSTGAATVTGRVMHVTPGSHATTVQVGFPQTSAVARSGSTRVTMTVTTSDRRDVLLVATQALLALGSGGDALQLPGGRLIAVHTGAVQQGDIAVSGPAVHAGLRVVSVQ